MKKVLMSFLLFFALLLPVVRCADGVPSWEKTRMETFGNLEAIRIKKKKLIIGQLEDLQKKVKKADSDQVLMKVFRELHQSGGAGIQSHGWRELLDKMDRHYVNEYGDFYDILFVRNDGFVFYSIKLESDYRQNLFQGDLEKTQLSRNLKDNSKAQFIDYSYYPPSREPASFFVKDIVSGEKLLGWIVFQFSINAVNSMLSERSDDSRLGMTGEVYLANESKIMLTDSRFLFRDRIMKQKVDTEAIKLALEKKSGSLITEDYRGVRVFSSVEKFFFAGSVWIIVAEKDEDEVVTEMFNNNRRYFVEKLWERLQAGNEIPARAILSEEKTLKVDINDYAKGAAGELLVTRGVTTCTGIAVTYPGRFAYLGHLYPLDETYYSRLEKFFLNAFFSIMGGASNRGVSDLLSEIIHAAKYYDVYPSELRNLKVLAAAAHKNSFEGIIKKLLKEGLLLSQIRIACDPNRIYLNIITKVDDGSSSLEWIGHDSAVAKWTSDRKIENLGSLVKFISNGK